MKKSAFLIPLLLGSTLATYAAVPSAPPKPVSYDLVSSASLTPCTDLPALPTAQCGSVLVDRDRKRPSAGKTKVVFAVIPRTDRSKPSLGTIVPNPGGPGVSTIDIAGPEYAAGLAPLMKRRDVLLMDPRGVGRSDALTCPALSDPARAFGTREAQRKIVGECGHQLGARVSDYGTAAVADDLDDIRAALHLDKLDLLGDSYGTFLMTTYAQRHPRRVQSVVLSGAYDVHTDGSGQLANAAVNRAIGLVCDRTGKCRASTVRSDIAHLSASLRAHPTSFTLTWQSAKYQVVLDERQWAGTVSNFYSGAADTDTELALARAAAAARTGDLAPVKALVTESLTHRAEIYAAGSGAFSDAVSFATTCHDYPRTFDYGDSVARRTAEYNSSVAALDPRKFALFSPEAWVTRADYDGGMCLRWPDDKTAGAPFPVGAKLPDVPVLALSGDLDANTATAWGRQAAAQFPHATFVEVKGAGHTPTTTPQGTALILDFISHPHR
ncbi:alpha/beta hydrolase [Streptomyces sp. NPDC087851]|uniref:alpha/beta hydrolase n=1 Tax=Streptomyces sp. NPDC087851 TaxID=3365810 RepID=UPI003818E520